MSKRAETKPIQARFKPGGGKRHSGRSGRTPPYDFSGGIWTTIPADPFWECVQCNRRIMKSVSAKPPAECGNKIRKNMVAKDSKGRPVSSGVYEEVIECSSKIFRDDVDISFFRFIAERNPGLWEVKEE